jgi:hypothetical protein
MPELRSDCRHIDQVTNNRVVLIRPNGIAQFGPELQQSGHGEFLSTMARQLLFDY